MFIKFFLAGGYNALEPAILPALMRMLQFLFYQLFSGRSLRTTAPACHISVSRISRNSSSSF